MSVPGQTRPYGKGLCQAGFSLLEILIVLVIIGIVTATAGVSAFGSGQRAELRHEAMRLAQLFDIAQAEARALGRPIVWQYDAAGYQFTYLPRPMVLPLHIAARTGDAPWSATRGQDDVLRARSWQADSAVTVAVYPVQAVIFNTEWMPPPRVITLSSGPQQVKIVLEANGQYRVTS